MAEVKGKVLKTNISKVRVDLNTFYVLKFQFTIQYEQIDQKTYEFSLLLSFE